MKNRSRLYDSILHDHLARQRQMVLVSGPRQVGKTTTCRNHVQAYLNWDNIDHREQVLRGPSAITEFIGMNKLSEETHSILFDELHKFPRWKTLLKGLFDTYSDRLQIIVTGSSRMQVYRRGGDSLMGRYLLYRMHPFSVAELVTTELPSPKRILRPPAQTRAADFDALWRHGGYPEPFLRRDLRFSRRWQSTRRDQLVREDIRELTQIQNLAQLEALVSLLLRRSSHQLIYDNAAKELRVSVDTVRRWVDVLCDLHLGFLLRPWFKNVTRSLRKEPKWFLRDWAGIADDGDRSETFVACHLLKAVEGWNDLGLGRFELGYIRDKEKREVDFVVVRDAKPWFLVEVKYRETALSPHLKHYQDRLAVPYAFQVVIEADYVAADCFARRRGPMLVPARTFLSQLL